MDAELDETVNTLLEQAFDQPITSLRRQLARRISEEIAAARETASSEAARSARVAAAEALNLAARRIRHAASIAEAGAALLETATAYCARAALLVRQGENLAGWRASGFSQDGAFAEAWANFRTPVRSAPALAQAIETRDAVVSLGLPGLSPELIGLLGVKPEERAYLFPLSVRQRVVAILYADGSGSASAIQPAALELLCSVTEASMEALSVRPAPAATRGEDTEPEHVHLATPAPQTRPADWDSMSAEQRELHLRAQRFARVLVADLQLYRPQEIREGRKDRNLYTRLKDEIDKSRDVYFRKFAPLIEDGVDYFHLELVRTLAGNEEEVLGPEYPGPLTAPLFR
jgi:hypothetical protein